MIIGGAQGDIGRYKRLAARLRIGRQTIFIGPKPVSDLPQCFARADVLVSPRIKGINTPMKIYSYLDSGKPLIATRLPTHTQVLDREIAVLVDAAPHAMAEGMLRLLGDEPLQRRLARNAKERVQREYTFETYHQKISRFYDELEKRLSVVYQVSGP
jgi:glycosyltransferase involved in cell wall biosynthesis